MSAVRPLHFVFKVADRAAAFNFYNRVLGMKCSPYENRWSKSMVGYGSEDNHFVLELTYNYGVTSYDKGNDFLGIIIKSKNVIKRVQENKWPMFKENEFNVIEAPGGYKFFLIDESHSDNLDPIIKVQLACSNFKRTLEYWNGILGFNVLERNEKSIVFGTSDGQTQVEFVDIGKCIEHGTAYGRIAFSCPYSEQEDISKKIELAGQKILTPLITLDTPGKATVRVIILADPDGHEICFVDDKGFRELSKVDPKAEELLTRYINLDQSRDQ